MARARNIKPGFFSNDSLAEAAPLARILFAGLWCFADREGRLEDRPKKIKAEILPYDDCDADELLNSLAALGFVLRYEIDGARYIQVLNFDKHQNPHVKEQASEIPAPDLHRARTGQEQGKNSECTEVAGLIPSSLNPHPLTLIPHPEETLEASPLVASKLPTCPQNEILALYAEHLPELPQPRIWEGVRQKNLAARWKWVITDLKKRGKPCGKEDGLDFFLRMFGYISHSDHLMGRSGSWSCSLDWIVGAENFAKIIQGNYDNKATA